MKYLDKPLLSIAFSVFGFAASATVHSIEVKDGAFVPAALAVQVGDTVRWFWNTTNANDHTTTSVAIPAGAAAWDQAITAATPEFLYAVTLPGQYDYQCTPHAKFGMVGGFTATGIATVASPVAEAHDVSIVFNSNGVLTVTSLGDKPVNATMALLDLSGRLVQDLGRMTNVGVVTRDIGGLPSGFYVLQIREAANLRSFKMRVN